MILRTRSIGVATESISKILKTYGYNQVGYSNIWISKEENPDQQFSDMQELFPIDIKLVDSSGKLITKVCSYVVGLYIEKDLDVKNGSVVGQCKFEGSDERFSLKVVWNEAMKKQDQTMNITWAGPLVSEKFTKGSKFDFYIGTDLVAKGEVLKESKISNSLLKA